MLTTVNTPLRPEVAGRLNLADRHRRLAERYNSPRHLSKAQKHEHRDAILAARWQALHPKGSEAR